MLTIHVHTLLLLDPSFLSLVLLSFPLLSENCLEVLGAAIRVLAVARVLEGASILKVGKLLCKCLQARKSNTDSGWRGHGWAHGYWRCGGVVAVYCGILPLSGTLRRPGVMSRVLRLLHHYLHGGLLGHVCCSLEFRGGTRY